MEVRVLYVIEINVFFVYCSIVKQKKIQNIERSVIKFYLKFKRNGLKVSFYIKDEEFL